jgi:hypothetical protein
MMMGGKKREKENVRREGKKCEKEGDPVEKLITGLGSSGWVDRRKRRNPKYRG